MALGRAAPAQAKPQLPVAGTVVFYGDSITWQNHYPLQLENMIRWRYPGRRLRFVNRGIRGDTASRALARVKRDLKPLQPALVVVMLGMNDGGYRPYSSGLVARYQHDMGRLVRRIRKIGSNVVLVTPTCVAPLSPKLRAYNKVLQALALRLRDVARSEGVALIDLFTRFRHVAEQARRARPPINLMQDAIHPNAAGHLLIADHLFAHLIPREKDGSTNADPLGLRADLRSRSSLKMHIALRAVYIPPAARSALPLLRHPAWATERLVVDTPKPIRITAQSDDGKMVHLGRYTVGQAKAGIDLAMLTHAPWAVEQSRLYRMQEQRWPWAYYLWDPNKRGLKALRETAGFAVRSATPELARRELKRIDAQLERRSQQRRQHLVLRWDVNER